MKTLPESFYTLHLQEVSSDRQKGNNTPLYKITKIVPDNSYNKKGNGYNNDKYADTFETEQRRQEMLINRERRRKRTEEKKKARRHIIAGAAIVSGISAAIINIFGGCQTKPLTPTTDTEPYNSAYIDQYEGSTYEDALDDLNVEQTQDSAIEEILNNNPDVQYAYENLSESVSRFSDELGENAIPLIKERIELLGNGKVDILDVLKVLHIESRGRIYDPENPNEILKSSESSATGAFQLKPDTVEYLNYYFNLTGTPDELDVMDPYDNLDACILYLRIINSMRQDDIDNGIQLPTGDNIKHAIVWGYHDGPWSKNISYYAQKYIEDFDKLSAIENYPEVVDYLINE